MALHPQAKEFLDALAAQNLPGWDALTPEQGRTRFAGLTSLFGDAPAVDHVEDRMIPGGPPVRVYTPKGDGPFPALMYFHGGGWVLGDRNTHDALCRRLANEAACLVVAVEYGPAPEHKYPESLNECFTATQYVAEHAEEFRVDRTRVAVAGDSAGGNLAASVALMARDQDGPALCFQLLIYPVTCHRFDTGSYKDFAEGFGLSRASMIWFWGQYLRSDADGNEPGASPLFAENLRGLPPAHVITAEFDVLRDEGEAFADRLTEAGVPVSRKRYEGIIHGFVHCSGAFDLGKQAAVDAGAVLRDAFAR